MEVRSSVHMRRGIWLLDGLHHLARRTGKGCPFYRPDTVGDDGDGGWCWLLAATLSHDDDSHRKSRSDADWLLDHRVPCSNCSREFVGSTGIDGGNGGGGWLRVLRALQGMGTPD